MRQHYQVVYRHFKTGDADSLPFQLLLTLELNFREQLRSMHMRTVADILGSVVISTAEKGVGLRLCDDRQET